MPDLSLKSIPPALAAALKEGAAGKGTTVRAFVLSTLARAVKMQLAPADLAEGPIGRPRKSGPRK